MADQIEYRVVLAEDFVWIKLRDVALRQTFALKQPPHPLGDGVGQLRPLGERLLALLLEAWSGAMGRYFVGAI